MIKPIVFVQFLLLLILFSCVNETDKFNQKINYSLDSLNIKIDSSFLNNYYTHSYNDRLESFVGYDGQTHSLDFFDIKKRKTAGKVKLAKEGEDGVGIVYGIYYHSTDSIFVSENGFVKLLNIKGEVTDKYNLNSISNSNYKLFGNLTSNQYVRLQYLPNKKSLLLFSVHEGTDNLNQPLLFMLNIVDRRLTPLSIYFSDYFIENKGKLGFLSHLNAEVVDEETIVYNYLYSNSIYMYNLKSRKTKEITHKDNTEFSKPLPPDAGEFTDKWEQHAIENAHFFQILKDPYRHKYYQFSWLPMDFKTNDGKYNSFMEKRLLLTVMDEQFNKKGAILLQANVYMPFSWFVSRNGLMISNAHPKNKQSNEKNLTFHIINVD